MNPLLKIEDRLYNDVNKKAVNPLVSAINKVDDMVPWKAIGIAQGIALASKALYEAYAPRSLKEQRQVFFIEYESSVVQEDETGSVIQNQNTKTLKRMYFDAVFRTEHLNARQITSHPVQSGANISDHSYRIPSTLLMDIGVSDVMANFNPENIILMSPESKSKNAFASLIELMNTGKPVTVYTRLRTYKNMVIEKVRAVEDYKTLYELRAQIDFQEVIIAEGTYRDKVSADSYITKKKTQTTKSPVDIEQQVRYGQMTGLEKIINGSSSLMDYLSGLGW